MRSASRGKLEGQVNKQTRAKLMTDVLVCLKSGYRIELVGSVRNCPVVADQWPHKAAYYSVGDNGGEIHVHELNSSDPGRSVAYETIDGNMNAGTMAYRVACVMHKEKIDWALRFSAEELEILMAQAA